MPKPVLSDSLFNADDVATAVLAEANLQIANGSLAVTDFSDDITIDSSYTRIDTSFDNPPVVGIHFNGIVFIYSAIRTAGSTPASDSTIMTLPSAYAPARRVVMPTSSYQGDTAQHIYIDTSGVMKVKNPQQEGHANFNIVINGFYLT